MFDGKYARLRKPLYVALSLAGLLALVLVVSNLPLLERGAYEAAAVTDSINGIGDFAQTESVTKVGRSSTVPTTSLPHLTFKKSTLTSPIAARSSNSLSKKGTPTAISGEYVIGVVKGTSLTTVSSAVTALGGTVLYTLQYSNNLVAKLTSSQVMQVKKVSSTAYVDPNYIESTMGSLATVTNSAPTPYSDVVVVQAGSPLVAIVDDFSTPTSHGYEMLGAYQAECAAKNCGIMNPTLISDVDSLGDGSEAAEYNAIDYASTNGAHWVNVSLGAACSPGACNLAGQETDVELNSNELTQNNGTIVNYAAGNNVGDTEPGYFAGNPYGNLTVYVGAADPTTGLAYSWSSVSADVFVPSKLASGELGGTSASTAAFTADEVAVGTANPTYTPSQVIATTEQNYGILTSADLSISYNNGTITVVYNNIPPSSDGTSEAVSTVYTVVDNNYSYSATTNIITNSSDGTFVSGQNLTYMVKTTPNDGGNSYAPTADSLTQNTISGMNPDDSSAVSPYGDYNGGVSDGSSPASPSTDNQPLTAPAGSTDTGGATTPLVTNPDDTGSQTPVVSNTPSNTTPTPITVDSNGDYSVTVPSTTVAPTTANSGVTPPAVNPDLTPNETMGTGRNGVTCETGPLNCK